MSLADLEMEASPPVVLSASGVTVHFGGLAALSDVDVDVPERSLVGVLGPNGAGKSTLFGVMSGFRRPTKGIVRLRGKDVTNTSPQARARMGIARWFQHPELFQSLTVFEHLVLAYRMRFTSRRLWSDLVTFRGWKKPSNLEVERTEAIIELRSCSPRCPQTRRGPPDGHRPSRGSG